MNVHKKFLFNWSDLLSNKQTEAEDNTVSQYHGINHYSHKIRSKKHFLKSPFQHVYLTPRELETVKALLKHNTMKSAALALGLSHRTVEFYLKNIKKKVGCYKKNILLQLLATLLDEEV